jgi:hypothetical protein
MNFSASCQIILTFKVVLGVYAPPEVIQIIRLDPGFMNFSSRLRLKPYLLCSQLSSRLA